MKLLILLSVMLYSLWVSAGEKTLHFAFLSQRSEGDAFWGVAEKLARAASQQLNVKITVYYARGSRQKMLENLQKAHEDGVDAVLFPNLKVSAHEIIIQAEALHLPVFLFNADLDEHHRKEFGVPGQYYQYWLGSLMPDDDTAGYLLGKQLVMRARHLGLAEKGGEINVVAINGTITDTPAIKRLNGLKRALIEDGHANLLQSVYSFWEQDTAREQASRLHSRYPQAKVFWGASDLISIGISEALMQEGWVQGKDYVTGGIDWSLEGVKAVQRGKIQISVGGQFMEAAWVVIMLHDYFNGVSLPTGDKKLFSSKMVLLSDQSLPILLDRLQREKWDDIDFRQYSRFYNSQMKEYQFDPRVVLKAIKETSMQPWLIRSP